MAEDIVMPRLSDSMEEGTVLKWMKSVGDEVALGDELVEIETDKANMVFEADAAGTLIEIVAGEGDTLPIGEVIARVGDAREAPTRRQTALLAGTTATGGRLAPDRPRVRAADSPEDPPPRRRRPRGARSGRRRLGRARRCARGGEREGEGEPDRAADR